MTIAWFEAALRGWVPRWEAQVQTWELNNWLVWGGFVAALWLLHTCRSTR